MTGKEFAEEYFRLLEGNQTQNISEPSISTSRRSFGNQLQQVIQETGKEIENGLKSLNDDPWSFRDLNVRKTESERIQKLYNQYQGIAPFLSDQPSAKQTADALSQISEKYRLASMTSNELNSRIQELEGQTKSEKASDPFSWLTSLFGSKQQQSVARNPDFKEQQKERDDEITKLKQQLYYTQNYETLNTLPENLRQSLDDYVRNSAALEYVNTGGKGFADAIAGQNSTYLLRDGNRYTGQEIAQMADSLRENPGLYGQLKAEFESAGYDLGKLLEFIETVQGNAYAQESAKDYQKTAKEHPVLMSIASVLHTPFAMGGAIDTIATAASNAIKGEEKPVNLGKAEYLPTLFRNATRETVAENIDSDIGKAAYNIGMSIADMATTLPMYALPGGQAATLAINAGNSAAATAVDITQRGGTPSQAATGALVAGVAETVFDRFGLDGIFKADNLNGVKGLALNLLKSAGVEGAEEAATEFVNILADQAIMGDQSNYNINVANYISQGMTEDEAKRAAQIDLAKQVGLAAIGGATGGGLFGSIVQVPGYIGGRRQAGTQPFTDAGGPGVSQDAAGIHSDVSANASRFVVPDMSETAKAARANAVRESGAAVGIDQAVIDTAAEVAANTGRNIQFVTTIGEGINGRYDSGTNTLTIAADSQNPLETVLKHELTHSLEETGAYTELRDYVVREMIEPSLSSKGVHIADVVEAKMAQYAEAGAPISYDEAMREVVADYSAAKLFTDETAIRKLTAEKPGLARRFLDWIHSVYEKIRTRFRGTPEEQRLRRAEQLYQEALQSPMARRDGTQFSLVQNPDGTKYVDIDTDQDIFDNVPRAQWPAVARRYINEHFRGTTVPLGEYDLARVKSKTSGEYTHPYNPLPVRSNEFEAKMKASTELDNLLRVAEYAYSAEDTKNHSGASLGWDYYRVQFMLNGRKFEGLINIANGENSRIFYDITKVREVPAINREPDTSLVRSSSISPEPLYDTSVTQNTPDVNTSISENGGADTRKQSIGTTSGDIDQDMLELVNRYSRRQETPIDIAQMRPEEANTTPPVAGSKADTGNGYTAPRVQASRGDSQSHFAENLQGSPVVDEQFKEIALEDIGINTYDSITDQDTLTQANNALNDGGYKYVTEWFSKPTADATAQDIATGIILMSRYQATGDYEGMVNAARKLRGMGTNAGQTVQMFSILGRMTPEGMIHYAQKSLDDAFELMVKNRSKAWADRNREKFRLSDADVQFILDKTQKAAKLPAGRDKNILLGEIAARIQNKLPPEKGQSIRALARISMLLNPKTFVRNVLGNVSITPVSWIDDLIGAGIDRAVSKASGTRTTGGFRPSSVKGLWEGMSESFDDWRRKINTRDIDADRFEIGQGGPNFRTDHKVKPLNGVSKALNALDRFTSFTLDVGDRPFFNMWFMNSLNNQMKLNGVSKPTAEMIEVARQDALSRTWQDTNGYTKFISNVKNALNAVNVGGYGLGDVFIKFTKTPANLTKALVDYSPVGVVRAIASDGRKFSQALAKGEAAPQMQRKFVNSLSKGITGSILMVLMASLANAGVLKGKGSDDPDVADFEENVLGLQPYSVKIGDKTYSYEWMQPLGGTAAIIADIVQTMKEGDADEFFSDNPNANAILSALQSGGQVLYDQSFMQSLANLFESDNMVQGILNGLLSEPSAFVPQFFSQIAMLTDDTVRRSYVSGQPLDTAVNKVKAKIPGLRSELEPVMDVLGRDVPSNNSLHDVFLNPANTSTARPTEAANEMYRLYNATGDIRVIPPKAPNTITYTSDGDTVKKTLTAQEKTEYQRITGEIAQSEMDKLIGNSYYRSLTDEERADLMADIYSYANAIAKSELSDYTLSAQNEKQKIVASTGLSIGDYLMFNMRKDADGNDSVTQDEMRQALDESGFTEGQKAVLWKLQNKAWKFNPYRRQYDYVEEILKGALS